MWLNASENFSKNREGAHMCVSDLKFAVLYIYIYIFFLYFL